MNIKFISAICLVLTFRSDQWQLPLEVGVVQQNQFVSTLARASVAARVLGEDVLRLYCKGAPEAVARLCRPDTGIYTWC